MQIQYLKSQNIMKTWMLLLFFFGLVVGISFFFSYLLGNKSIFYMGVVFALVMNGLSYWYSDKWAIALNRARPIGENEYKQVQESVARLSVLAQVPVPSLYVIESNAMNAFATGRDYNHSALAVTSGLVARLTPEQLDGVLAHEIGHIKNYDIRLMALAGVLAGLVSIIANFFLRMSLFGGNNDERREGGVLLLALAFLFAILAPLFAQLLHLAISRKREFLADATSAYITKNPRGLASALREISRDAFPLTQAQPSTAHLFIANPFRSQKGFASWLGNLFATHPAIEERVEVLEQMVV